MLKQEITEVDELIWENQSEPLPQTEMQSSGGLPNSG